MPDFLPEYLRAPEVLLALGGLLLVFVVLLVLAREPDSIAAFENEAGSVTVSRHALHELIQQCCEEMKEVGRARVRVEVKGGVLHTTVRLKIRPGAKLENTTGYLQEQISEILKVNLGLGKVGPIDIRVTGVLPEPSV